MHITRTFVSLCEKMKFKLGGIIFLLVLIHAYCEHFSVYYTLQATAEAQKQLCKKLQADMIFPSEHVKELAERCHYIQKSQRSLVRNPYLKLEMLRKDAVELDHYVKDVYYRAGGQATGRLASLLRNTTKATEEILENSRIDTDLQRRTEDLVLMKIEAFDRIDRIQNPESCQDSKILLCEGNFFWTGWGFGSRLNYLVVCLAAAFASERRAVFDPDKYYLTQYMLPYTATCQDYDRETVINQNYENFKLLQESEGNEHIVKLGLPQFPKMEKFLDTYPPNFPKEFGDPKELSEVLHDPYHWYIGILTQYLYRLRPEVEQRFMERWSKMGIDPSEPLVGIQLRRTDIRALREVPSLFKYMVLVDEFHSQNKLDKKRVFVATDELATLYEILEQHKDYEIIANRTAINNSYSDQIKSDPHNYFQQMIQVENIIFDMWTLSKLDYAISVYSSNIGRIIYQLRVADRPDARFTTASVDEENWFLNGHAHFERYRARLSNSGSGQLPMSENDTIEGFHHWDFSQKVAHGVSFARNLKTGQIGKVPYYKLTPVYD